VTIPAKTLASVRRLALASVGALLVTALHLVAVRGEALILDLAKLGSVSCFGTRRTRDRRSRSPPPSCRRAKRSTPSTSTQCPWSARRRSWRLPPAIAGSIKASCSLVRPAHREVFSCVMKWRELFGWPRCHVIGQKLAILLKPVLMCPAASAGFNAGKLGMGVGSKLSGRCEAQFEWCLLISHAIVEELVTVWHDTITGRAAVPHMSPACPPDLPHS
jgi:hypothetical protein